MAEEREGGVIVFALSGAFAMPGRPLPFLQAGPREQHSPDDERVRQAFEIAGERRFDHDPRFSLVVRSEIAGRALSPAGERSGYSDRHCGNPRTVICIVERHPPGRIQARPRPRGSS